MFLSIHGVRRGVKQPVNIIIRYCRKENENKKRKMEDQIMNMYQGIWDKAEHFQKIPSYVRG